MENSVNFEVKRYIVNGFYYRFKVSLNHPKNFVKGDKYIVIGSSITPQIVKSEEQAYKLNHSIMNEDKIRRCYE